MPAVRQFADSNPEISIVIPARNEERELPLCLAAIGRSAALCGVPIEIVVVINRCTDATEEIARAAGCVVVANDGKNLSAIRNSGVAAARGKIVVTVDADSRISENMLQAVLAELQDDGVVGGGVLIKPERLSSGILLTGLFLLPYVLIHGISGGLFFVRRDDFDRIGGFDEALCSAEDIDFAKRLKAHGRRGGRRFRILYRAYIVTSCRKFDRLGDWYFVKKPWLVLTLLKGRNQAEADKIWYDFER